jgi:Domain of unknown function (DUF5050)
VCGDCCELTEGGATTFAICLTCVKRGGKSLIGGWLGLLGWLGAIIVGLVAIAVALVLAGCSGGSFSTTGGSGASSKLAVANGYAYSAAPLAGLVRSRLDAPTSWDEITRGGAGDGTLHLNATHVFWRADNEVRRIAHGGGTIEVIGTTIAGVGLALAVDDDFVYFARGETLVRHVLADGTATDLFQNRRSTSLALAGETLIGTTCAGDASSDAVWSMPADGSASPHRLLAAGCPEVATVDDSFIYMFDLVEGRPGIQRISQRGGDPVRLVESPSSVFAVRDGFLYAIDADDRVVRVSAGGGDPEVLVDTPVAGIAVDDTHLYYTHRDAVSEPGLFRTPLP